MFDHFAYISGDWITDLIITATLILFAFFFIRALVSTYSTKAKLRSIIKIKELSDALVLKPEQLTPVQLTWVTEHLIYSQVDDGFKIEADGKQWLSKSPISLMVPSCDTNRYKLVPALLTSIGITGTFLGITIGLSHFSMAGDSKALLSSAAELLEGLKTAFYTSLAGLSTSAIFMALLKWSSSSISNAQQRFLVNISKEYFEASAVYYLKDMGSESQRDAINAQLRSADTIELMGANIADALSSFGGVGDSFNGDVIASKVSEAMTGAIETQMVPALDAIKSELSTLKDIKEQSQQELVSLLVKEMKSELIEPVTVELQKTSEAVLESNEVTAELNRNVEKVVTSTAATVSTINDFQKETMVKLQEFAESLKTILTSFSEETQGAMGTIASEVKGMLGDATDGMEKQRIAFEQSSQTAASAFQGIKESMDGALSERQSAEKTMFESVTSRINTLLSEVSDSFDNQTQVITKTGEVASGLMTQAQNDFEKSVESRREGEKQLFSEVEMRIGNLLESTQTAFTQQSDTIKEVGESAQQLMSKAQSDFEKSVESRREGEKQLFTEMENRISQLLTESQGIFQQQTTTLKETGAEASKLMISAREELEQGLGDIDDKVLSMSRTVQSELEVFREQYQQNLTKYFKEQNDLLDSNLGKQRDGLNGVVDNFRKVFEEEYQTRHTLLKELTAQYQNLEKSAGTLERVAKAIGLNDASKMAELQNAATTMSQEISSLKKEYTTASAAFTQVTEELPKAMDDYYARATKSFETFFNDFDHASSKIHNRLAQAANYLVSAQEVRQEVVQDKAEA
ncbi:hypothetical protein APQ14_04825 [Vibrio toranzoniae]|uniref:Uncharacterized protein n=1 Tax=Vibrio toranzoniae TaxID=1194427 RepID=A0A109DA18_9VIBR|nr:hypothetical protein [Vibrio toranzoniae]KWU01633.1 hypothetical protein APQ14_04825 [Vibrio toranzoniae]